MKSPRLKIISICLILDPVNPFNVIPLQPNAGENRYNGTNYNDNRPYDTTRATTYPPFDGRTKRPTLPTRVIGNTTPSTISKYAIDMQKYG